MAAPGFAEQFRRMLTSKLRVVFENASGELEMWSKSAQSQVETQLRERRRSFTRRRDALQRVQGATGELESAHLRSAVPGRTPGTPAGPAAVDALAAEAVAAARGQAQAALLRQDAA
jgi:hypothetical protein